MSKRELKQQQWHERIAAYRASGLSRSAFCREQNLNLWQLNYWLRKENPRSTPSKASPTWIPVEVNPHEQLCSRNVLQIKVGVATIEVKPGFDEKLLGDVIRTLSALC